MLRQRRDDFNAPAERRTTETEMALVTAVRDAKAAGADDGRHPLHLVSDRVRLEVFVVSISLREYKVSDYKAR